MDKASEGQLFHSPHSTSQVSVCSLLMAEEHTDKVSGLTLIPAGPQRHAFEYALAAAKLQLTKGGHPIMSDSLLA